jgi:hypothetical protein
MKRFRTIVLQLRQNKFQSIGKEGFQLEVKRFKISLNILLLFTYISSAFNISQLSKTLNAVLQNSSLKKYQAGVLTHY